MATLNFIPLNELIPGATGRPFQRDELAQTSFRPTIIVGIGGSGLKVALKLKKLLRRHFQGEQLEIFQFVVFDTAAQEVPEGQEPLDAGEFVHLGAFDAADMIRYLDENPHIARWWPGAPTRPYRPSFSGTGAHRVRAVGRLVLYNYMSSVIIPRLEAKIDRAIEVNAQHGMGATSVKFYVVSSLAGGTGSGMVLDLAYVARMLGLRRQPTAYVTGVLVTDDAFRAKAQTANTSAEFSANTYAALREINHFSITRTFRERYDDLVSTEELPDGSFRPFDIAYLLGLHNTEGQALDSFESLTDMIAAEMMLEIASPLQDRTTNVLDNVRANDRAIAGQPAAYSSFALSSLVYPLPGIASWCALTGHAEFSRKVFLDPERTADDVAADVLAFTQKAGVEEEQADRLIERLATDDKGEVVLAPSLSHDQVGSLPEGQLLGTLQRLEESALSELARLREIIMDNVRPVEKLYLNDVKQEGEAVLRDPQRGPRYTGWFLATLGERLTMQRDQDMVNEQAFYRAEVETQQTAWQTAWADLARALLLQRWLPWRGRQVRVARDTYVTAFNNYLNAMFELERRTQAILAFNTFIEETRRLARRANDMVSEWLQLSEMAQERANAELTQLRATETEYSLMRNIVGREELHQTYKRHLPEMDEEAQRENLASQFWHFFDGRAPGWTLASGNTTNADESNPAVQAYYFLAGWYARQLEGKALIERLKETYGDSWQREIELRYRQTAPFWNYNLSRFGDQIRNNLQHEPRLVGYGEGNVEQWGLVVNRAIGEPMDSVNNKNPHEMLFLKTSHGLPLFALRSANQTLRTTYQYVKRLWDEADVGSNPIPVHISRLWEPDMPEIAPSGSRAKPETAAASTNGHQTPVLSASAAGTE
jgi:hypothetical protein